MDLLQLLSVKNIIGFVIIITRLSGMITTAPFFSTYPIPNQIKVWLVTLVAFVIYPMVVAKTHFTAPTDMVEMTLVLAKEFAIGALIGFLASLIIGAVQMGGQIIAMQSGLAMSNVFDPTTQSQVPIISEFYVLLTMVVFFAIDAHHWLFAIVYQSFMKIPPGLDLVIAPQMVEQVLYLSSKMFEVAVGLVMPVFCVLFVLEVLLGVLSKMIPQMNIFMVSLPIKIYIGLFLMMMFMLHVEDYIVQVIQTYMASIVKMFM